MTARAALEKRVLILTPTGRDSAATAAVLSHGGIATFVCHDLPELVAEIRRGAGAVFVAEEALIGADGRALSTEIEKQPPWSDLPVVLLTSRQDTPSASAWREETAETLRNVSLVERPIQGITLIATLRVALRSRLRQYETRQYLEAKARNAEELERLVSWRTAELEKTNRALHEEIAERQRAEERLRHAQKMEAIGQLTGGLAHDFNNMLTGIGGSLELMEVKLDRGRTESLPGLINAARGAVKRAAALTHRLLAFSRRQTLDPKAVDVNRLVNDMAEFIRRSVGPSVDLEIAAADDLWPTLVDFNQLENAVLNLCINARDAMPDGGRLTIETANTWLDEKAAAERDLAPGLYVSLSVADTGTGMSPEIAAKAFDPFFTTKPLGEGTGLGLSMIYGFARQSGGQVRIHSEVGVGTRMCLYLPRHDEQPEADPATARDETVTRSGKGKVVLVVDDEPAIRMLAAEVLEGAGYIPIEASDGQGALKILQSNTRLDLLITDVGLPNGMNGRQIADAARELRPQLEVLFITGYAEKVVVGNGHLQKGMHLLTKPFDLNTLERKIHEIIDT